MVNDFFQQALGTAHTTPTTNEDVSDCITSRSGSNTLEVALKDNRVSPVISLSGALAVAAPDHFYCMGTIKFSTGTVYAPFLSVACNRSVRCVKRMKRMGTCSCLI